MGFTSFLSSEFTAHCSESTGQKTAKSHVCAVCSQNLHQVIKKILEKLCINLHHLHRHVCLVPKRLILVIFFSNLQQPCASSSHYPRSSGTFSNQVGTIKELKRSNPLPFLVWKVQCLFYFFP